MSRESSKIRENWGWVHRDLLLRHLSVKEDIQFKSAVLNINYQSLWLLSMKHGIDYISYGDRYMCIIMANECIMNFNVRNWKPLSCSSTASITFFHYSSKYLAKWPLRHTFNVSMKGNNSIPVLYHKVNLSMPCLNVDCALFSMSMTISLLPFQNNHFRKRYNTREGNPRGVNLKQIKVVHCGQYK